MTANKASPRQVLVLDMSSLRFRWNDPKRSCVSALSSRGEVLSLVEADPAEQLAAVAFRAMDDALARATVLRTDSSQPAGTPTPYAVALYNPLTGEVSVGGVPDTVAFSCGTRLVLDAAGSVATLTAGDDPVLRVGDQELHPVVADRARGDRVAAAVA